MVTIVCVLRSGGPYGAEYVLRLKEGIETYFPQARFVCLSDVDVPCERIELRHDWPGWWAKLELFRVPFEGPVLYLDLDTLVRADLSPLMARPHTFTMLSDFFKPQYPASGVMAWEGDWSHVYEAFRADPKRNMANSRTRACWGDGGFIAAHLGIKPQRWQDLYPGMIVSRKVPQSRNPNERLLCYHGRPRPAETGWAA